MEDQGLVEYGKRPFKKVAKHARHVGKFAAVTLLAFLLLIPLSMVEEQISDRGYYQRRVTEEISNTAAGAQTLIGPVLAISYRIKPPAETFRDEKTRKIVTRQAKEITRLAYLPAQTLTIDGQADVERRYRGIYEARLFHLNLKLEGHFKLPADLDANIASLGKLIEAHAVMLLGLSDARGMDTDPEVIVDQRPMHFSAPKNAFFDDIISGSRLELDLGAVTFGKEHIIDFSIPLKLTGTEKFSIAPTAENNSVRLQSTWQHPSFHGRFLPRSHKIDDKGFTAQWEISQLARDLKNALDPESGEAMRVDFINPVNIYLQSERSVKYGSLFIVMTFAAFFLGEILRRQPMHIMQYLLVGLSLAIFFLLLVALSEQLPFLHAYLVSAVACIGLIVSYLAGIFCWRMAFAFGGGLAGLYAMLYAILQLEDKALLMGSLLLFAALTAVMMFTRRFDWYGLANDKTLLHSQDQKTCKSAGGSI